ncbi:hypothetical protein DFP72DRAFT_1064535 [Ephemerocybe angulata]|uniref:Uncharacterized protein n=1 Tax=Ephemerocybe angulata TaxID=980116 RepID=A0A8H6I7Q6_9AGAR|nr:hypothetical protein DFP72DRAFT_1064535 [Tulosesus angulatus]
MAHLTTTTFDYEFPILPIPDDAMVQSEPLLPLITSSRSFNATNVGRWVNCFVLQSAITSFRMQLVLNLNRLDNMCSVVRSILFAWTWKDGRSTLTSILLILIQRYQAPETRLVSLSREVKPAKPRHSYTVVNSNAVKADFDEAIDQCSEVFNLRDSIEEARERAYGTTGEKQKRARVVKGMHDLRRYFELIVFQAYQT